MSIRVEFVGWTDYANLNIYEVADRYGIVPVKAYEEDGCFYTMFGRSDITMVIDPVKDTFDVVYRCKVIGSHRLTTMMVNKVYDELYGPCSIKYMPQFGYDYEIANPDVDYKYMVAWDSHSIYGSGDLVIYKDTTRQKMTVENATYKILVSILRSLCNSKFCVPIAECRKQARQVNSTNKGYWYTTNNLYE